MSGIKFEAFLKTEPVMSLQKELSGSGQSIGYRQMHQMITSDHGLVVER